jgi:signal transduction histidine kinase
MDNGAGILKEIKDKIMEPFFSTKELRSGQGLGLSISKGIIESHGGELTCMETPQGGTSFSLWIPYQQLKVLNK